MRIVKLTQDNFSDYIEASGITVVKFTASWCGPCQSFAPIYEKVAEKYLDVTFAEVDTEAEPEIAVEFAVRSIPYLMVLKDKVLVYSESGTLPESALVDLINQAKALDMSEVKQNIQDEK